MRGLPKAGEFVDLRGRLWLVEEQAQESESFPSLRLSCVDDDAQGETASVIWDAEIAARSRDGELWEMIGDHGTDDAALFAAFLRTIRWNSSTAADRELFQAPFRAGIRMDAYQLAPLKKALQLPRVNLLIADDVGLGKTVEAGLVMREMLLRKRIDFIVVLAPPSMTLQWEDELATKFGLAFEIIDRELLADLRRTRGFGANPWAAGSRFILSHKLLGDETYTAGLREVLGSFQARTLLILDEAHHCAPSVVDAMPSRASSLRRCGTLLIVSNIGCFFQQHHTMDTPTALRRCWKSSIPKDLPAAWTFGKTICSR